MEKKYTDEDVVRFLYDEMTPEESEHFLATLYKDDRLWERYEYLQDAKNKTKGVSYEPSEMSLQLVMDYVEQTHPDQVPVSTKPEPNARPVNFGLNFILMSIIVLVSTLTITATWYFTQPSDDDNMVLQGEEAPANPLIYSDTLEDAAAKNVELSEQPSM